MHMFGLETSGRMLKCSVELARKKSLFAENTVSQCSFPLLGVGGG